MRVGAHATRALRGERLQLWTQPPVGVEQLLRLVTAQPVLELLHMGRVAVQAGEWHLMGAPEPFHLMAIHFFWASPALGTAQHDHGPAWPGGPAADARLLLE